MHGRYIDSACIEIIVLMMVILDLLPLSLICLRMLNVFFGTDRGVVVICGTTTRGSETRGGDAIMEELHVTSFLYDDCITV